jgi:hypothetical protein
MNRRLISVVLLLCVMVSLIPITTGHSARRRQVLHQRLDQQSWIPGLQSYANLRNWLISKLSGAAKSEQPMSVAPPVTAFVAPPPFVVNPPTAVTVTTTSDTLVALSWTAPGAVDHYHVERSQSIFGPFLFQANTTATTFNDTTVGTDHAYLYRVRAVAIDGSFSVPSNMAFGTATSFEFTSLSGQLIKAQHFYDVRTAINAVRTLANRPVAVWTRTNLAGLTVEDDDLKELRDRLDDALQDLGVSVLPYDDPILVAGTTLIRAIHIEQLQSRSTRGSSSSSGSTDSDSSVAAQDPLNATGGDGENPLSRNFNWTLPVVSLPGRARMDLSLSLSYNSLVWLKSGSSIIFDGDHGTPSPGFRLSFPLIKPLYNNPEVGKAAYLLIGSDGSRTELRQVADSPLYEAANSSHLLLDTGTLVTAGTMTLKATDGSQMKYSFIGDGYQCTEVRDRNGNYVTVNYTTFGRIDTVIDTVSRTIKFNYAQDHSLTSITQAWSGQQQHTWATFAYEDKQVNTNFNGLTVVGAANNQWLKVLKSVTLDDNSHYEFETSNWIQVWKITAFGTDGHVLNYHKYNLPTTNTVQSDCPRFTERRDWIENWNRTGSAGPADLPNGPEAEVVTQTWAIPTSGSWTFPDNAQHTGMIAQVTQADNTYDKIYYEGVAGTQTGWRRGLMALVETYGSSNPAQNAPINKQRAAVRTWTQDGTGISYLLNPRVEEANVYDFNSSGQILNRLRTTITYTSTTIGDGTSCKLPSDVTEYLADAATALRRTNTTYLSTTAYLSRRIIGLPTFTSVYSINPSTLAQTLVSKTGVDYDEGGSILGTDTPVQHDNTAIAARGNASTIKRYDTTPNSSASLATTLYYDTAGSLVKVNDGGGHQLQISYADQFYADGVSADAARSFVTLAYPTTFTDPDNYTTRNRYNYEFGAATWKQTPLPNSTSNLAGPSQKFTFDSGRRLQRVTNLVNNAYTRYVYGPNYVELFASINTANDELHSLSIFDGIGRPIASAQTDPNTASAGFNGSLALMDTMGRMAKQSAVAETSVSISGAPINPYSWSAQGIDATENNGFGWLYVSRTFDWKGRPLLTTNTDGTTTNVSYEGCGCAGGEVATLTDEGTLVNGVNKTRQQKTYRDVVGRIVKTEIWDFDGSGPSGSGRQLYATSITTFDALNQPTLVRDFRGAAPASATDLSCPSGDCQHTDFTYDGYGRLRTRHLPSQEATTAGTSDHTTWEYNPDDTIHSLTDARGVVTTFTYNNRHLTTNVAYNITAAPSVESTNSVSYAYDAAGNRTSMTDAAGTVQYHYDSLSRMDWEDRTFSTHPNDGAYRLSYEYNLAGLVTKVFDEHAQRGFRQTYDATARLTAASAVRQQVETQYAAQIKYRASGAMRSMSFNGATTTNDYDRRGLLIGYSSAAVTRDYEYHNDGQIKFVADNSFGATLDRAYAYDLTGRLKEAFSGTEAINYANNASGGTQDGPYHQNYTYDVWSNQLAVTSRLWSRDLTTTLAAFSNDRQPSWSYDNDGRLKTRNEPKQAGMALPYLPATSKYDGAGREVLTTQTRSYVIQGSGNIKNEFRNTTVFDGSDQVTSYANTLDVRSTVNNLLINTYVDSGYFLRSTVLGGRVISEYVDDPNALVHNYVYAGTERIGDNTQLPSGAPLNRWFHVDPVTGDTMTADDFVSGFGRTTLDPQGLDVGEIDPFPADGSGDPDGIPDQLSAMNPSPIPLPGAWSDCVVDGIEMNCAFLTGESSKKCPNNDCKPRWNPNVDLGDGRHGAYEQFYAFQNGYSGYMTDFGRNHYTGGGTFYRSGYEAHNNIEFHLDRTTAMSGLGGLGLNITTSPAITGKTLCDHLDDKLWTLFKSHANEVGVNYTGAKNGRTVTDCYIYGRNVLTYAYEQVGRKDVADAIRKIPNESGAELAKYLAGQGWHSYYWNPDVRNPRDGDAEHVMGYQTAVKTGEYYGIPVNDYVINYRKTNTAEANDTKSFSSFQNVRFAFGIARGGVHNFMYSYNTVYEVHWDKDGADLYERSSFYNDWPWLSGVMLTPPDCN